MDAGQYRKLVCSPDLPDGPGYARPFFGGRELVPTAVGLRQLIAGYQPE
jgi:hypothetical protein